MTDRADSTAADMDVIVITAVKDEFDAVLSVSAGQADSQPWRPSRGGGDIVLFEKDFAAADGGLLRFGLVQAYDMGESATVHIAMKVLPRGTRCLAMCGVCAGRRGKVALGDVIFADRVWTYDTGKIIREVDESGSEHDRIDGDVKTWNLWGPWRQAAERYSPEVTAWQQNRPLPIEFQGWWVLSQLAKGVDPSGHVDRRDRCPNWFDVIQYLRGRGLVSAAGLTLTANGQAAVTDDAVLYPDGHPEPPPFAIHVGPIASGNAVREDHSIFARLSRSMRKVQGLEMEASAIGFLASMEKLDHFVVAKGVMDFGDTEKADHFKQFAARASAECLVGFLRAHLPSARSPRASRSQGDSAELACTHEQPATADAVKAPAGPAESGSAFLMWTRETSDGATATHIVLEGGATVVVPGLFVATTESLWCLTNSNRPVRILPAEVLEQVHTSGFDLDEKKASRVVALGDSGLADRVSLVWIPLGSPEPHALATEALFEHERRLFVRGTVGPYVFSVQSDWRYGGGAHPDTECRFTIVDLENATIVHEWLTDEERAVVQRREAAVARKAFEVMREDERLMDVDSGTSVDLVAARPFLDDKVGELQLEYQFATFTSYVQTDGHWSSYHISEFVPSRTLPRRFEPYRLTPKKVIDAARLLPRGTVLGGWSRIDATHAGWAHLSRAMSAKAAQANTALQQTNPR